MSIWCAMIFIPAGLIIFTKHGPVAYNGLIALYIPLGTFFAWMCGFTVGVMHSRKRDANTIAQQDRDNQLAAALTTDRPATPAIA
jgi:hypothetical protein